MTETLTIHETDTLSGLTLQENDIESVCIVMPTYNEATNITRILDMLFAEPASILAERGIHLSVLVVDDSSPDGTAKIVQKYMQTHPNVKILIRNEKNGLGRAYIAGMQYAMDILAPDVVIEMDADLSHDPQDVPRLVSAIEEGADFVIGSRYVDGGSIPEDWGAHRKFTSACANMATRMLLGISNIRDCSGGFRAIRTSLLKKIDWDKLSVKGYAFQAILLEEALYHDAYVAEVPIAFSNREEGDSKMSMNDMLEGFTAFSKVRARRVFNDIRGVVGG